MGRGIIAVIEMPDPNSQTPTISLQDSTLVELAHELRRLATDLLKDVRKSAALPGLSQLAAMKPLQHLIAEALAERAFNTPHQNDMSDSDTATEEHCYVGYL
jgi:hypothetical protein